jgi:outer membrane protein OmpA-like peptidoglycan-associated protein
MSPSILSKIGTGLFLAALLGGCAELQRLDARLSGAADNENIREVETAQGLMLVLRDVLFDTDQASLRSDAERIIARTVEILASMPERNVLIAGHTDNRGSDSYNQALSRQRAESVSRALQQKGIASSRIILKDYGKNHPVMSNDTAEGRQRNRRVEITILNPGALLD